MDAFAKVRTRGDLPMLHTPKAMRNIKGLARRRRDIWCEIRVPGKGSGFSGADAVSDMLWGRFKVAIQKITEPKEVAAGSGSDSSVAYEIVTDVGVVIPSSARLAVPAFFAPWAPETEYAVDDFVTGASVQMGAKQVWQAIQAGSSDYFEPDWNAGDGGTIADGTVIWRPHGVATFYEIVGTDHLRSNLYENQYFAKTIE